MTWTLFNPLFKLTTSRKGLKRILSKPGRLEKFTPEFSKKLEDFFAAYKRFYQDAYNKAVAAREAVIFKNENEKGSDYNLNEFKNRYYNESLADLVKNVSEKDRIVEYNGQLIQQINPIFLDPKPKGPLDYRAHFFAPQKNLVGATVSTFLFNNLVIWIMTVLLYITLYFELLRKLIDSFDHLPGKMSLNKATVPKKK